MLLHSVQTFMARPRRRDGRRACCRSAYAGDPPPWLFQCDLDRLLVSIGGRDAQRDRSRTASKICRTRRTIVARPRRGASARQRRDDRSRDRRGARGDGAIAALPVVDTLKEVDDDGRDRAHGRPRALWRAQTPQGFPRDVIERAHVERAPSA